tara:strand:+ start:25909 stop:26553 length:645 start_codon:yes stop_codon:yes gene_type:complete
MFDKNKKIIERLKEIDYPVILELGVNKGRSTKRFFEYINTHGGDLYSIDIRNCRDAIISPKWNFFQCNDLNINEILKKFPNIKKGIDLLFIDSYHDPSHVKSLLNNWFYYIKKGGLIYLDDTESYLYRLKKNSILAIVNDSINDEIKKFYHKNYDQLLYTKYYKGSGLAELQKISDLGTIPDNKIVWEYNNIFAQIYIILKRFKFYYLNKFFKK